MAVAVSEPVHRREGRSCVPAGSPCWQLQGIPNTLRPRTVCRATATTVAIELRAEYAEGGGKCVCVRAPRRMKSKPGRALTLWVALAGSSPVGVGDRGRQATANGYPTAARGGVRRPSCPPSPIKWGGHAKVMSFRGPELHSLHLSTGTHNNLGVANRLAGWVRRLLPRLLHLSF